MSITTALVLAGCSFALCVLLVPLVRYVAVQRGLVDLPDGRRKIHLGPIPLAGGIAIFLAVSIVLALAVLVPNPWTEYLQPHGQGLIGYLLAAMVVCAVGVADDYGLLRGRHKLL